jgi:hypothetical protein
VSFVADRRLRSKADDVLDVEGRLAAVASAGNDAAVDRDVIHSGVRPIASPVGGNVGRRVRLELYQGDFDALPEVAEAIERVMS